MQRVGSYPIEDFLEAITAQLDKTQDALRLKSINRPLTFALKDFNLNLQVFVEMDEQGQIRFRPSGPNEQGSSTVSIGFTTITRPMIEENTVSMELTKSPSLEEVGLAPEETKRLERLGVRNAVQLKRLESEAGDSNISRIAGVDISKLRKALQMGDPQEGIQDTVSQLHQGRPRDRNGKRSEIGRIQIEEIEEPSLNRADVPKLEVSGKARRLKLRGIRTDAGLRTPRISLDKRQLSVTQAGNDELLVTLPQSHEGGLLEIELEDGGHEAYQLVVNTDGRTGGASDPWMPGSE